MRTSEIPTQRLLAPRVADLGHAAVEYCSAARGQRLISRFQIFAISTAAVQMRWDGEEGAWVGTYIV